MLDATLLDTPAPDILAPDTAPRGGHLLETTLHDWHAGGRTFRHRGYDVFYRRGGFGTPLLVLHGFPTASYDFHRLWPALTGRFDVVAPDLIGFGFSARPPDYRYSTFDQADLVEELLADLGLDAVHVLAHDYGDTVAQELLVRELEDGGPPVVRSVVFTNGGLFPDRQRLTIAHHALRGPWGPLVQRVFPVWTFRLIFGSLFGPRTRPTRSEMETFWRLTAGRGGRRVLHPLIRYLDERDRHAGRWADALARTDAALRLVYGPADPVSGDPVARRFAEVVPHADVVRLDGVGHYPQVEAPDRVLAAFEEFHERIAGGVPGRF